MKIKFRIICFLGVYNLISLAAPLENIPITITQPNGMQFTCYTSGDEFYHWLHDSLGNIIIKDTVSNYYCYVIENSDSLVPVSNDMPSTTKYSKSIYSFQNRREELVEIYNSIDQQPYRFSPTNDRTITTINNIVVFITFADQGDYSSTIIDSIARMHNKSEPGANSMKQYYWESSYHQLNINSFFYPQGMAMFSYQDSNPRSYYCPQSSSNPNGYIYEPTGRLREQWLLYRAISYVQDQIPSSLEIDTDDDGYVDNVTFVIKGATTEWNTILWPHKSSLTYAVKYINGKRVYNYNLQLSDYAIQYGVGVLCHEFGHTLGLPDLYHGYADPTTGILWKPVGVWDIMASNGYFPQQISGYMKYKYLHWIGSITEITRTGRYSLSPISSSTQCYKINIDESDEFLYLEYRNNLQTYDIYLPHSGLLIYRINPSKEGNFNAKEGGGINDEVYVYRPNGTFTNDGSLSMAPFCVELGSVVFNENTNPQEFLSNGYLGNIYISNISNCGSAIHFNVKFCKDDDVVFNQNSTIPYFTNANTITTTGTVIISDSTKFEAAENIKLNKGFKVLGGAYFKADVIPCE